VADPLIEAPQPILHERDIGASVEQMHRNRVAERISTLHILSFVE